MEEDMGFVDSMTTAESNMNLDYIVFVDAGEDDSKQHNGQELDKSETGTVSGEETDDCDEDEFLDESLRPLTSLERSNIYNEIRQWTHVKRKWEQLIEEIKVRDESALFSSNYFWIVNVDFDALQDDVLRHLMSMITAWTKEDEAVEEEVQEHPWNQAIRLRSECVASAKNFAENARVGIINGPSGQSTSPTPTSSSSDN